MQNAAANAPNIQTESRPCADSVARSNDPPLTASAAIATSISSDPISE